MRIKYQCLKNLTQKKSNGVAIGDGDIRHLHSSTPYVLSRDNGPSPQARPKGVYGWNIDQNMIKALFSLA